MHTMRHCTLLFVISSIVAPTASAQSIDEALRLYKGQDYEDAAFAFFDVLANDADPDHRDQAEIYLAETLRKVGMLVPALFYYTDLFKAGRANRYYLNAVEGLLKVQEELHDPLWVPVLINELYDPEGFGQLDPERAAQINYLIGELSFRQKKNKDARLFLEYVAPESPMHAKARYLLGMLDTRVDDPEGAQKHFKAIVDLIDEEERNPELLRVRNLALLAAGRNAYGLGRFDEAVEYYGKVPRFSEAWFAAMYEQAWVYFRKEDYGRSLGELQSVTAPFFAKRFIPEAHVIRGTAYFVNCQWDRVRRAVATYKATYEPMRNQLKAYLEEGREPAEIYRDVVAGGAGRFSVELAREVRRAQRFKDYHFMLTHMSWERQKLDDTAVWKGSRLANDIAVVIDQHAEASEKVAGSWAKLRLQEMLLQLNNFQTQVDVLDFEVSDAERSWLEQGKEILKGRRARLPRPNIPNDQWQHWGFDREYWRDELGYIRHALRSECF
jgi:tetratricopeptide (TPR) repeat protein